MKNNKRQQTLILNVGIFFQTDSKLCFEYFCSSCKFEIPVVRAAVSEIHSQTVTTNK